MKRVAFCGAIIGSVPLRKGETAREAVNRAEATLLDIFERHAKTLTHKDASAKLGPNICLEVDTSDDE